MGLLIVRASAVAGALALLMLLPSFARAETFDLVTFAAPPGARSATAYSLGYADATPTTFAVYGVYRNSPGSGSPARDFAEEWQDLVARVYRVTGKLQSETVDWPGGWQMTMGAASVWGEQQRNFVALLAVFSGHGVKAPVLVLYNDDLYRPRIDRFLASIRLTLPVGETTPSHAPDPMPPVSETQDGAPPALTSQEWYRSVANYSMWGFALTPREVANIGSQGRATWAYRFQPNGMYTFVHDFWSLTKSDEYWSVEESGTYRQTADTLTLEPNTVQRILRDRAGRPRGRPESLPKESTTYRYAFQYLSGMERWYIVLVPEGGRETRRDGSLYEVPEYGKAYRYSKRPYCEQRPKPMDCIG